MLRRTLLALPAAGALGALLAACGEDASVTTDARVPDGPGEGRIAYGTDPSQYGELYLPEGTPRGVVVVIHGGFWKSAYDASLGRPLADTMRASIPSGLPIHTTRQPRSRRASATARPG